jgi:hypothetical protein
MGKIFYFLALTLFIAAWVSAFDEVINPLAAVCRVAPNILNKLADIPEGAIWQKETIRRETPPDGFGAVVGWIVAATSAPCVTKQSLAQIEIKSIKILRCEKETNCETVIKEATFNGNKWPTFERALFPRIPNWFGETEGSRVRSYKNIDKINNGVLSIDLAKISRHIYHGWTAPRSSVDQNTLYFLEVTAKITGGAKLQIGMDYWRNLNAPYNGYDENCNGTNNCEAWISDWYGDTNGQFVTFRAPKKILEKKPGQCQSLEEMRCEI